MKEIKKFGNEPADLQMLLNNSVSNVICALVFGKRFEYDDPKFKELLNAFNFITAGNENNIFGAYNFLPFLLHLNRTGFKQLIKTIYEIDSFSQALIKDHKETFNKDDEPADYIHAFMSKKETAEADNTYTGKFRVLYKFECPACF